MPNRVARGKVAVRAAALGLGALGVHVVSVRTSVALSGEGMSDTRGLLALGFAAGAVLLAGQRGAPAGRLRWVAVVPGLVSAGLLASMGAGGRTWAAWGALALATVARAVLPAWGAERAGPGGVPGGTTSSVSGALLPGLLAGLFAVLVPAVAGVTPDPRYLLWAGSVAAGTMACAAAEHVPLGGLPPEDEVRKRGVAVRARLVPVQLGIAGGAIAAVFLTSRLSPAWTPLGPILAGMVLSRPLARALVEKDRSPLPAAALAAAGLVLGVGIATA